MKKNLHKSWISLLKSNGLLAICGSMLLASCATQVGGYSETDGVYYDPNKDTLPQGVIVNNAGNRVGEYYDYEAAEPSVIENSKINVQEYNDRYNTWSDIGNDSDWGAYTGTETYYNDYSLNTWGYWGYPWGWNSFYGYHPYWGYGNRWSIGWSFGWGWNSWYGYNPYFYGGWYHPYYWGYSPNYYGYYGNNWYNRPTYRRSGENGRIGYINNNTVGRVSTSNKVNSGRVNNGFRTDSNGINRNNGYRNPTSGARNNDAYRNSNIRNQNSGRIQQYTPQTPTRNYDTGTSRSSGFRSSDSGSTRSSGGFSGGISGGSRGGMRR